MKLLDDRNKRVRKPRTLHDAELHTHMAVELSRIEASLPITSLEKVNSEICAATLQQLSQSYGFLTDAIFSYLTDYHDGKAKGTVMRSKFVPYPEDRNTRIKMEDALVIYDKFSRFCRKAGITNPMQRKNLLDEIRGLRVADRFPRFATIGIIQLVRDNKTGLVQRFAFREFSFISYEFETRPLSRMNNLMNVKGDPARAISMIKLQLNYELFKSALIRGRRSGTRGYIVLPDKLEMKLRGTVKTHKSELEIFCKQQGFYYLSGRGYTKAIRSLFNMLARETSWLKDDDGVMSIKRPIRKLAATCCENTFSRGDPRGEFKRRWAVEVLTYGLEVMKLLFQDGVRFIEIVSYSFTRDHMVVRMRHHDGGGDEPQPD